MQVNYTTTNPIIISYPAYSGGKFIGNCLALSRHVCPQEPKAAEYLLNNPTDYTYRLEKVLSSLPPQLKVENWRDFEFGDGQLYQNDFVNWFKHGKSVEPNNITAQLSNSNLRFIITDHAGPPFMHNLLAVWPNATVIRLINTRQFQEIASKLKASNQTIEELNGNYCVEKYNLLKDPDWPSWEDFEQSGYDVSNLPTDVQNKIQEFYPWQSVNDAILFDMDSNIFDRTKFISAIAELYKKLGLEDFNVERMEKFYDTYIELHQ